MVLNCSACGAPLGDDDVRPEAGVGRCGYCHALTRVPGATTIGTTQRAPVPRPASVREVDDGRSWRLVRRWFSPVAVLVLCIALAWDGFLLFWYGVALSPGAPWILTLFPLAHVVVGLALTYGGIAYLVNRTVIEVQRGTLSVRHGPLPWRGNLTLPSGEIEQVYCVERSPKRTDDARASYEVRASLSGRRSVRLVSLLTDVDHALHVEQRIESRLGIRDRAVAGEIPR